MNHPIIMGILISLGSATFVFGGVGLLVLIIMSIEALAVIAGIGSYIGVVAVNSIKIFNKKISKETS